MRSTRLVEGLADMLPGPELATALAGLDPSVVPNDEITDVLAAQSRQLAHDQARLFALLHQTARCTTGAVGRAERAEGPHEWAAGEIAAALRWTPSTADRELGLAEQLIEHLPAVFTALSRGEIDRAKAWVFAQHLDPDWLTDEQIEALCARYVPPAAGWTTRQLAARLQRAILAIDPEHARRRYQRAVRERAVNYWLDPSGTVTLTGSGLSVDEAAAACARLDRLAATLRRGGHPGSLAQISADLYVGMLNGRFTGLTETQILALLLGEAATDNTNAPPEPEPEAQPEPQAKPQFGTDPDIEPEPGPEPWPGPEPGSDPEPWPGPEPGHQRGLQPGFGPGLEPTRPGRPGPQPDHSGPREGVEIRVGLATLLGLDQRPGEIPGLGPVLPGVARRIVAAQHRGAEWRFAVVDEQGYLILAGLTRRRPRTLCAGSGRVRGGIVELHLSATHLAQLAADPTRHRGWAGIITDLAEQFVHRETILAGLDAHPADRFAHPALARHIHIRDRTCTHIGCSRPARACDLDHALDHALGGATVSAQLNPECRRHHTYKHRLDWRLTQPRAGHFIWVSPLGRTYHTRGQPIMPPLPPPDARPHAPPRDPPF